MACLNCNLNLKSVYDEELNKTIIKLKTHIMKNRIEFVKQLQENNCAIIYDNIYANISSKYLTKNVLSKTDQEFFTIAKSEYRLLLCKQKK